MRTGAGLRMDLVKPVLVQSIILVLKILPTRLHLKNPVQVEFVCTILSQLVTMGKDQESRYKNDLTPIFCCNMGITNRSLSICVNFIHCLNFLNFVRDTNLLITPLAFKHREELYYSITIFIIISQMKIGHNLFFYDLYIVLLLNITF